MCHFGKIYLPQRGVCFFVVPKMGVEFLWSMPSTGDAPLQMLPLRQHRKKRKLWNKLFGKNGLQRHLFQFKDRLIDTFDTNLIFHKERNQNIAIH